MTYEKLFDLNNVKPNDIHVKGLEHNEWFDISITNHAKLISRVDGHEITGKELDKFLCRPEYMIVSFYENNVFNGRNNIFEKMDLDYCKQLYDSLLLGAMCLHFATGFANGKVYIMEIDELAIMKTRKIVNMLEQTGFYKSPSSRFYHEPYEGGLLKHSLQVALNILTLYRLSEQFADVPIQDAIISALAHDWCKVGRYEEYTKNVKLQDGTWGEQTAYKLSSNPYLQLGHGVSSLFMLTKYINVNTQLASAIRWHMGAWNVAETEQDEISYCNKTYPLVHMLQFADQLAVTTYEN